jgi:hypothetical protein
MEANSGLRGIVRRGSGEGHGAMLTRMTQESGIATPTADDLVRRARKGKKLSNVDRAGFIDPNARIAKLKDGRTRLTYKPEHALDLDSRAIIAGRTAHRRSGRHGHPAGHARGGGAEHLAVLDGKFLSASNYPMPDRRTPLNRPP